VSPAVSFARQVADRAETALPQASSRRFSIGDVGFEVVASSTGQRHLSRAFWPFESGAAEPSLSHSILAWDGTDASIGPPPRPWGESGHEPLGIVAAYSDSRVRCALDIHTSTLILHDREQHRSFTWYPAIADLPTWAKASPFRIPLSWLLNEHGMQMVHGAAVSLNGRAVLLAGPGGSGKSTTALACAFAGMGYLGDDYCAVEPEKRTVHMVYRTAKALRATVRMLPVLEDKIVNPDKVAEEKGIMFFDADDVALVHSADLGAILLPRISSDGRSRLQSASRRDAMHALLPSTVGGLMGGTDFTAKALLRLVQNVPAFTMELGTDLEGVKDAVSSVLERAS